MFNVIKALSAIVLIFSFCNLSSFAMTPDEYCQIHKDSKAPGSCIVRGDCAVLTTNLGTEECKVCTEGGCELVDSCDKCSE